MTKEQMEQFKTLFSAYCKQEADAGRCAPDACLTCPVNKAYEEIFPDSDEDEGLREFLVTDIQWDTDGEDIPDLPTKVTVKALDEDDVLDVLSDTYGWCVTSCNIEEVQA